MNGSCPFAALDDHAEWKAMLDFSDVATNEDETTVAEVDANRANHAVLGRLIQSLTQKLDNSSSGNHFLTEIPICSASHESKLLSEPYEQPLPDGSLASMRPCVCGDECLGFHEGIQNRDMCGGGCVLREMLFPDELKKFETTGELPTSPKACVLCHRQQTLQVYLMCQGANSSEKVKFGDMHINLYINPKNCQDGYFEQYTIPFAENLGWTYMLGPVVINKFSKYKWVKRNNVWFVDQSFMLWTNF